MDDLVAMQQAEIETLRERIRQLEDILVPPTVHIPLEWCLPNAERRCFAALCSRDIVTKEHLYAALYGDKHASDKATSTCSVESHMSKLKKKLARFGVEIRSERFVGYSLVNRRRYLAEAA